MLTYLNAMEARLLGALLRHAVRFAVVGGHAVLCYSPIERPDGIRRFPDDLDILVDTKYENLIKLSGALAQLCINLTEEQLNAAFAENKLPNLAGGYGVQLFPRILGVETEAVLSSTSCVQSSVGEVPVICESLLIEAKRACERPKDVEDLQALLAANDAA